MARIVLISVQPNLDIIGLKSLHHLLLASGHESTLLYLPGFEADSQRQTDAITQFVRSVSPALVGISVMEFSAPAAADVSRILHASLPDVPILWGGVHASTSSEECLKHADYVCVGEGEQTLLDIAAALDKGQSLDPINNLCYLRDGALVRNPLYPLETDLDKYPVNRQIPASSFVLHRNAIVPLTIPLVRRYRTYLGGIYKIMTSRGCPHGCTYCVNRFLRGLYGKWQVRRRGVNNVMQELEAALREGPRVDYVDITDDCFLSADVEYIREFAKEYKARIGVPFIVKGTSRYFSREKLDLLYEAGMGWINMGLQSGSERVCRDVYKRNVPPAEFLAAAQLVAEYPVAAYYDVIVDNPFETPEERLATVEVLMQVPKPFYILVFSLRFYRGTEIRDMAEVQYPGDLHDHLTRDFRVRDSAMSSDLLELTPLLPHALMRWLLDTVRGGNVGLCFRALFMLASLYGRFVAAPMMYLRLTLRSQHGSIMNTLRVIPTLFAGSLVYYVNNFRWFKRIR